MIKHPFPPLFKSDAQILILGSFPSVKSRETGFFYGHKQNRFWKVMAEILQYPFIPLTVEDKTDMLARGRVALWDTIASCDIKGSSDSSITNVVPNDLGIILEKANIRKICCNGTKSYELFMKYTADSIRNDSRIGTDGFMTKKIPEFVKLPSTSPANAAWSLEKLEASWKELTGLMPIDHNI